MDKYSSYSKEDLINKIKELGFEFLKWKLHPEDYDRVMDNMRQNLL